MANILVDGVWPSGRYGMTKVQQLLGVKVDGIVGEKTLAALNARNPLELFNTIKRARVALIEGIVAANSFHQLAEAFRDIARRLEAHADEIDAAKME